MDILDYNRRAWDREVESGNPWTIPVSSAAIAAARQGDWQLILTPTKPVPQSWYPEIKGRKVLCLASGGGQQGPILAAAGAHVTVFDNSPRQLAQDRLVAERDGLAIELQQGDMADLSCFPDATFDLIVHPVSNVFVPDVRPVWREAFRVLKPGGVLLSGFCNPVLYIFDLDFMDTQKKLKVRYAIPYSDLDSLTPKKQKQLLERGWPLEFGHSLQDQIGGQLEAGFLITGLYEDIHPESELCKYIPIFISTRAIKPGSEEQPL
jgi:SAM-dependent methyltransferase